MRCARNRSLLGVNEDFEHEQNDKSTLLDYSHYFLSGDLSLKNNCTGVPHKSHIERSLFSKKRL